jgi:hypothetical protein
LGLLPDINKPPTRTIRGDQKYLKEGGQKYHKKCPLGLYTSSPTLSTLYSLEGKEAKRHMENRCRFVRRGRIGGNIRR